MTEDQLKESQRIKFEYETVKILPAVYFEKLTEYGLQGWEFCQMIVLHEVRNSVITQKSEVTELFYITFKRVKI
jgi:hypothetical protein